MSSCIVCSNFLDVSSNVCEGILLHVTPVGSCVHVRTVYYYTVVTTSVCVALKVLQNLVTFPLPVNGGPDGCSYSASNRRNTVNLMAA